MFNLIASALALLGVLIFLFGGLLFILSAFEESILWGLGVLFLPLFGLIFLFTHWHRAKEAVYTKLCGIGAILLAVMMSSDGRPWPFG